MKKQKEKLLFQYLKQRRRGILAGFFFCTLFAVSFALYKLPVGAVAYPAALCLISGTVFVAIDFLRIRKKHKDYSAVKNLTAETLTDIPAADGIEEKDLQEIIAGLKQECINSSELFSARLNDTIEYYTVWAHQIKTPIAAMKLTLQNEDTQAARQLLAELFRIERYVDMVMAYLRLNSKTTDFVFREFEIDRIIKNSVKRFSSEFINRKIKLEYTPTDSKLITDEKWFSFVFEQILSNALKYTPSDGTIKIYI